MDGRKALTEVRRFLASLTIVMLVVGLFPAGFTFADISIISATVDGGSTVTVAPGASAEVSLTVNRAPNNPGSDNDWESTQWNIVGDGNPAVCVNTPDHTTGAGTDTEAFNITAPSVAGSYDLEINIFREASCGNQRDSVTLTDGIVVEDPKIDTATAIANSADVNTLTSVVGQSYAVMWIVEPASGEVVPTGSVTVSDGDGNTCIGALELDGTGQCDLTSTSVGVKPVTAIYGGDVDFNGSISVSVDHTVVQADTTTTITNGLTLSSPTLLGQSYDVAWLVAPVLPGAGTPTGVVTITVDGGVGCSADIAAGQCGIVGSATGTVELVATYGGDDAFLGSESGTTTHEIVETGSIKAYKWYDINGDGIQNEDEPALSGWTICLDEGEVDTCKVTGDDGYTTSWDNLSTAEYTLYEEPTEDQLNDGWYATTDASVTVLLTEVEQEVLFGNTRDSINVFKFYDVNENGEWDEGEGPIAGWNMCLYDGSASDPATLFLDGFEGSGNLTGWTTTGSKWEEQSGDTHSGSRKAEVKGDTGSNPDNLEHTVSTSGYENIVLTYWYKISEDLESSDHVYVQWSVDGATWNTVADYTNQNDGSWVQASHTLPVGAEDDADFRVRFRADLGSSNDEFRLDDITVTGYAIGGSLINCADTDESGEVVWYASDHDLDPGSYSVTEETRSGWYPITYGESDTTEVTLTSGQVTAYFGNAADLAYVTGYKWSDLNANGLWDGESEEDGIEGWTIVATPIIATEEGTTTDETRSEKQVLTDETGAYMLEFLPEDLGWWRIAEESQDDWVQTYPAEPNYYDVNVETGTVADITFGNWESPHVQVAKWNDENQNGVWDEGEAGVEGWPMVLALVAPAAYGEEETVPEEDQVDIEIVALALTDVDGIADIRVPAYGNYVVLEGSAANWTTVYPLSHDSLVEPLFPVSSVHALTFADSITPVSLETNAFFDVFINSEEVFGGDTITEGYATSTEDATPVVLEFGNYFTEPETPTEGGGSGSTPPAGNGPITGSFGFFTGGGSTGQVLGVSTTDPRATGGQCSQYINQFMAINRDNDPEQVRRLQAVLLSDGFNVVVNGVFDQATDVAVRAFQVKYADEILTPWGLTKPTGFVYLTTRKKLNEIHCKGTTQFPLTPEQESLIGGAGTGGPAPRANGAPAGSGSPDTTMGNTSSETQDEGTGEAGDTGTTEDTSQTGSAAEGSSGAWDAVKTFFKRMFGR